MDNHQPGRLAVGAQQAAPLFEPFVSLALRYFKICPAYANFQVKLHRCAEHPEIGFFLFTNQDPHPNFAPSAFSAVKIPNLCLRLCRISCFMVKK